MSDDEDDQPNEAKPGGEEDGDEELVDFGKFTNQEVDAFTAIDTMYKRLCVQLQLMRVTGVKRPEALQRNGVHCVVFMDNCEVGSSPESALGSIDDGCAWQDCVFEQQLPVELATLQFRVEVWCNCTYFLGCVVLQGHALHDLGSFASPTEFPLVPRQGMTDEEAQHVGGSLFMSRVALVKMHMVVEAAHDLEQVDDFGGENDVYAKVACARTRRPPHRRQ